MGAGKGRKAWFDQGSRVGRLRNIDFGRLAVGPYLTAIHFRHRRNYRELTKSGSIRIQSEREHVTERVVFGLEVSRMQHLL
eukprot:6181867-Pleurochrysis_carterae.AAC.2